MRSLQRRWLRSHGKFTNLSCCSCFSPRRELGKKAGHKQLLGASALHENVTKFGPQVRATSDEEKEEEEEERRTKERVGTARASGRARALSSRQRGAPRIWRSLPPGGALLP
ncbi:unnamed protein product [Prorocentrum cordatum]|uniref:Uncharacterized protein n=1 Tax=Prorocentrum cordatum TaxID=2364126 RepID=A0ABN9TAZ7_9DINO|nr:unnamed protein product [Polarella glacialis]